jgi:tRNA threonylcarbamoyladenosine biosynthesis protein TsaB
LAAHKGPPYAVLILALDTTTRSGSVAVLRDQHVLTLVPGDGSRTHGERLPAEMACALEAAGVARDALDLLAVATGPGAFTGLRIGLAAIQGLAMALDKPVVGVSALDALVRQSDHVAAEFVAPWMDAQRGDVFAALHQRGRGEIEPPIAAAPAQLIDSWSGRIGQALTLFVGDAVTRDAALIASAGHGQWIARVPDPLAPQIGAIARERAQAGHAGPPHALEPIYVRRPDAEIERERRGRR